MTLQNASRLVSLVGVSRFAQQMIGKSDPTTLRHESELDALISALNCALDRRREFLDGPAAVQDSLEQNP